MGFRCQAWRLSGGGSVSRLEALGSVAEYELSMGSFEKSDEFLHLVDCNGAERLSGVGIYCPRSGARRGGLHQSKDALLSLSLSQ